MKSLDDAWRWYNDVRTTLRRMGRFGKRYWDVIPWDQHPWQNDPQFQHVEKGDVIAPAANGLQNLDDLAILVLFSVFEAVVRGSILTEIEGEAAHLLHRVLRRAVETARDRVGEGSFFAILESYKGTEDGLIEEVNQVRRYRNWVAHGKRGTQPPFVGPATAYERLNRFLSLFFPSPTTPREGMAAPRDDGD